MTMASTRVSCFCVLLFLIGFWISPVGDARAQERKKLGLDQLVQMALERSPEIREAEQDVLAANSELSQAKAGQWAQLDVLATIGPSQEADTPIVVVDPKTGIGLLRDRDEDTVSVFGMLDIAITQPLYTFGKISNRQDAARFGVEAKKSAKIKKQGDVILNVKELYYALIVAMQGKTAAKDADEFAQDARRRIQRLIDVGSKNVDRSDLYRLEAYTAEIEQFKVKAESGAQLAYMALKRAIGYPPNEDFSLDAVELPKNYKSLAPQEEYIRQAMERRPEFEQLKMGIAAKQSMVKAAKADLYPSFFLAGVASFAGSPGREELEISYFRDDFNHIEGGMVLGSHWHFDLGIGTGKLSKARAEHQKLVHTLDYAEQNIPLEVAKYYHSSVEARAGAQAYEKASIASRKWIVTAFSNFDFGVGSAKDMFDAIEKYGKNQGEYLRALYNYNVSQARLSHAVAEYRDGAGAP